MDALTMLVSKYDQTCLQVVFLEIGDGRESNMRNMQIPGAWIEPISELGVVNQWGVQSKSVSRRALGAAPSSVLARGPPTVILADTC